MNLKSVFCLEEMFIVNLLTVVDKYNRTNMNIYLCIIGRNVHFQLLSYIQLDYGHKPSDYIYLNGMVLHIKYLFLVKFLLINTQDV